MNLQTFPLGLHVADRFVQLIELLLAEEELVGDIEGRQDGDLRRVRRLGLHGHLVHLLIDVRSQMADIFFILFSFDAYTVPLTVYLDLDDLVDHIPSWSIWPMRASILALT